MSFAVKYRPKVLEDMVGQEVPVKIIRNLLKRFANSGNDISMLPRSIIVSGAWGSGKTTAGRMLARYLNCVEGPLTACGKCASCIDIDHDRSRALIEQDAASKRGIHDIQQLKERTTYKTGGRITVVILDEVHQLTRDAWSALLKVLEEGQNVLWILATTDPQKILETVVSRSTVLQVSTVTPSAATPRLIEIAQAEGFVLNETEAQTIAFLSKGHMRDAIQLMETSSILLEEGHNEISLKHIYEAANMADFEIASKFVNLFWSADENGMIEFIQTFTGVPAALFNTAIVNIHQSVVNLQSNDPIPLADKILLIELLTKARMEFNSEALAFPFTFHYYRNFQENRVRVG